MKMNEKEIQKLMEKLEDGDPGVRENAAKALLHAAIKGQDITPAVPALVKNALSDEDLAVRWNAAGALIYHYVNKGEWNKLGELVAHDIKQTVVKALASFVQTCNSVEKLDNYRNALENFFVEWLKRQPQGRTKEKIEMELKISGLLMAISKRKAELSKEKGELLLGDTVKKPDKDGKKIYRSFRMVSRNG